MSEAGVNVINGSGPSVDNSANSRSSSPSSKSGKTEEEKPKKFLNGWTGEQERLMADWSDIASCYRWLHDQSEKVFHIKNLMVKYLLLLNFFDDLIVFV